MQYDSICMICDTLHEIGELSVKNRVHFYLYSKSVSQIIVSLLRISHLICVLFYVHLVLRQYPPVSVTFLVSLGLPKSIRPCISAFRLCFVKLRQDSLSTRYSLAKESRLWMGLSFLK